MNETACDYDRIAHEELPQAKRIASWMALHHHRDLILDVGCGPGIYVDEMCELGLNVVGIGNDPRMPVGSHFRRFDLAAAHTLGEIPRAHVVLSLEVGEHIPAGRAFRYIAFLKATHAEVIYFSAARPGQGGEGHINCRPKSYWLRAFADAGFYHDPEATDAWLSWLRQGAHMEWLADPVLGNGMVIRRI